MATKERAAGHSFGHSTQPERHARLWPNATPGNAKPPATVGKSGDGGRQWYFVQLFLTLVSFRIAARSRANCKRRKRLRKQWLVL